MIKRVVVTGVGTPPAVTVVEAFRRRGWLVVGVDAEFHPHSAHQFYLVSRGDRPGFVDELLMLVRRERTTLLIPTRDAEWLPIASRSGELRRLGAAVFLPEPATVEDIVDERHVASLLRRMGIDAWESVAFPLALTDGVQWFEATVCRDGRIPYESFACSVHELCAHEPTSSLRAERRKGESEVEDLAARVAQAMGLPGPATVHVKRDADGRLGVVRVALRPCDYGPLTDDILDAFLALWERVHPP